MTATTTRTTSTVSADQLTAAYFTAAQSIGHAIVALHSIGHAPGSDSAFGTVVADLHRIRDLCGERAVPTAKPPVAAPTVAPMPATVVAAVPAPAKPAPLAVATGCKCPSCQWSGPANQFVTGGLCKTCFLAGKPLPTSKPAAPASPAPASKPAPVTAPVAKQVSVALAAAPTAKPTATVAQQHAAVRATQQAVVNTARVAVAALPATPVKTATEHKADGLSAYRQLQAACKAAGVNATGTKAELTRRLDASKATASQAAPVTTKATPKATAVQLYAADGKGGYRPATEAELLAAFDAITAPASK